MSEFTHINAEGRAKMVNVGDKAFTDRTAVARGEVIMQPETIEKIKKGAMKRATCSSGAGCRHCGSKNMGVDSHVP